MNSKKTRISLITIVTEGVIRDQILDRLRGLGVSGFTVTRAEGEGESRSSSTDWAGPNQRIESLVSDELADEILEMLGEDYFDDFSVVAWCSNAYVLRPGKYAGRHEA